MASAPRAASLRRLAAETAGCTATSMHVDQSGEPSLGRRVSMSNIPDEDVTAVAFLVVAAIIAAVAVVKGVMRKGRLSWLDDLVDRGRTTYRRRDG